MFYSEFKTVKFASCVGIVPFSWRLKRDLKSNYEGIDFKSIYVNQ